MQFFVQIVQQSIRLQLK